MEDKSKNIVAQGAEGGLILGVIFIAIFACSLNAFNVVCAYLYLGGIVSVPIVAYKLLRRTFIRSKGTLPFSAIWLEGIIMFLGGSMLMAVAVLLFFKFIQPDYMANMITTVLDYYRQNPETNVLSANLDMLQMIVDNNMLPRPIDLTMSIVWLASFSGSILSLILAAIVKARPLPTVNENIDNTPEN